MMRQALMYFLKPLVLVLVLALGAQANCAVSCVHSHSEKAPHSAQNCHDAETPGKSESDHESGACSHSQISSDRPQRAAQEVQPIAAVLAFEAAPFVSEIDGIAVQSEIFGLRVPASAPPITVLRI
jgi:hypothetical protein